MKISTLTALVGTAIAAATVFGDAKPDLMYTTSAMIPQADIDAFWKAQAARSARDGAARSLVSAARGALYTYRDDLDGAGYVRLTDLAPVTGSTLNGQPNPDGIAWQSVSWGGLVDNAVALSNMDGNPMNGEYNGPVGGPDPSGIRDGMAHVQRASVGEEMVDEGSALETYEYFTELYTGTLDQPLFVELDFYKPGHETFQWFRPVSYTQGCFTSGVLMGGYQSGGLFLPLAQMHGDPNLIEGAVILANVAGDPGSGEFVLNPKEISEHGWFTLGMLIGPTYMQILVRDAETLTDANMDGSPDWKMPMNAETGLRMFEEFGYGIEEGWASLLPGTLDDPMTTDIEGAGYAVNADGEVTDRYFFNGNDVATVFAKSSIDAFRVYHGSDAFGSFPGYEIQDWWIDDYRIRGLEFPVVEELPAYTIPYTDDMEIWNVGPLGLQGGRWLTHGSHFGIDVTDGVNHTPAVRGDAPSQALRLTNLIDSQGADTTASTGLPTTPRVRGRVGDPVVTSAAVRFGSSLIPLGVSAPERSVTLGDGPAFEVRAQAADIASGPVWTSCLDANGLGDGLVYVRQRKPEGTGIAGGEFDPLAPMAVLEWNCLTPDQEAGVNSPLVNVLAAPAGQSSYSLATDAWHVIRLEAEPAPGTRGAGGDTHALRVFVSQSDGPFVELFPGGDDSQRFTTGSLAPRRMQFEMPVVFSAGLVSAYVDDIYFDGPTESDPVVPLSTEYADDPAWNLPFADSLESYERGRPAAGQGYTYHRREFLPTTTSVNFVTPNDWDEIEFIAAGAGLSDGDAVRAYEIVSVDAGTPGFGSGDTVAVEAPVFRAYDPDSDIYGVADDGFSEPTEWYILDSAGGTEIARGTWYLANATGEAVFDSGIMTDMGARYSYRLESRFTGDEYESEFVSAAAEGVDTVRGGSGDVARLTNTVNIRDYSPNNTDRGTLIEMFRLFAPVFQTEGPFSYALMRFDMYVAQADFSTGLQARFDGGTASGGRITSLGFGGMGFQSGNANGGLIPYLPTGNFSVLIPNPTPASGEPQFVWEDTGVAVPTEQWFSVTMTVNGDSEFTIDIDGLEIASGLALDADDPNDNTNSLDNVTFLRNQFGENDGRPTPGVVSWSARHFGANALPGEHHYYRISSDLFLEAGQMLPHIWPVDAWNGVPATDLMGMPATRALQPGDIVALHNTNPATGQPFAYQPLGVRHEVLTGARGSTIATGTWTHLGLPSRFGPDETAPAGGIDAGKVPPYNFTAPFETILLGTYENVAQTTLLPSNVWYVDNFSLSGFGGPLCSANLDGTGNRVDAGDLAALLAAWGSTNAAANLDGQGVVDAGDLAILLAAWGPCPLVD